MVLEKSSKMINLGELIACAAIGAGFVWTYIRASDLNLVDFAQRLAISSEAIGVVLVIETKAAIEAEKVDVLVAKHERDRERPEPHRAAAADRLVRVALDAPQILLANRMAVP